MTLTTALVVILSCGVIGWLTNVIAVKMIFRPIDPVRVAGLTFQGVVPKHRKRFSYELARVVIKDFMTTGDMVEHTDPQLVLERVRPMIDRTFDELVSELLQRLSDAQRALVSPEMVAMARDRLWQEIEAGLPRMRAELKARADAIDPTEMVGEKIMSLGGQRLEAIIFEVAAAEFRYIEYYGGVFGVLIGCAQLALAPYLPSYTLVPVIGCIVGIVTNFLAIQMLFKPREPVHLGPIRLQGLFPRHQLAMAKTQARIAADELLEVGAILGTLRDHILPERIDQALIDQAEALLLDRHPDVGGALNLLLTSDQRTELKAALTEMANRLMPRLVDEVIEAAREHVDVATIMEQNISRLTSLRFEELLRGLFKQEEVYLLIYGGVLGALMGAIELLAIA